jgi:hypothetical protein
MITLIIFGIWNSLWCNFIYPVTFSYKIISLLSLSPPFPVFNPFDITEHSFSILLFLVEIWIFCGEPSQSSSFPGFSHSM